MRDLIVTENITLDGVIEATEGWFDAAGGEDDVSDVEAALQKQREAADALLLGRVTFEQMRGYWPLQTDDTTGITDYLNDVTKYVLSTTLQDPEWERTSVLRSVEDVRALKSKPGRDIVTTGSIRLVRELIPAGSSTSTGSSPIPSCSAAANGCSRTRPKSRACIWRRASPFAPASCSCATEQSDGAAASGTSPMPPTTARQPSA
jgi:dihydrofolate reductase